MSEINENNKKIYLELCKYVWDFDKESMEYVKNRLSDSWEPVDEYKELIKLGNYEDQRVRINLDLKNKNVQKLFEKEDRSYCLFKDFFSSALEYLDETNNSISYENFCSNKMVYKKNITKIKKVFEDVYKMKPNLFELDSSEVYSKDGCANWIVKKFEKIGENKKPFGKMQFVISFNPIDWLLSSTSEKWTSCFNIGNTSGGYQYCLGLPFLCGDKNRVMFYITDGTKKKFYNLETDSFMSRCWALIDVKETINIIKWYPNNIFSSVTIKDLLDCDLIKNSSDFSKSKYNVDVLSTNDGIVMGVYSDMGKLKKCGEKLYWFGNGKEGQQIFSKNLLNLSEIRNTFTDELRGNYNILDWIKLGSHLDMFGLKPRCKFCKEPKPAIKVFNSNGDLDDNCCFDCYDKMYCSCDVCKGTFKKEKITEVIIDGFDDTPKKVCPTCLKKYSKCDCCGKYSMANHTVDEKTFCNTCIKSGAAGYRICPECNSITKKVFKKFNPVVKTSAYFCEHCNTPDENNTISVLGVENTNTIYEARQRELIIE